MQTLAAKDLDRHVRGNSGCMVIDLRSRQDFLASHVRGAVNVPYGSLRRMKGRLPRGMELVFYCERGGSAMAAARQLSDEGYRTTAVVGAYEDISRLTETVSGLHV